MEQILPELAKQGIFAVFTAIFFLLYREERKEHDKTREKLEASLKDRITDSKENMKEVTVPLQSISQNLQNIGDKIEIGRGTGK